MRAPERSEECRARVRDAFREHIVFPVRRRDGFYVEISPAMAAIAIRIQIAIRILFDAFFVRDLLFRLFVHGDKYNKCRAWWAMRFRIDRDKVQF